MNLESHNFEPRRIYVQALRISDEQARAAFLDYACREDAPLRERVEKLLAAREQSGANLLQQAVGGQEAAARQTDENDLAETRKHDPAGMDLEPCRVFASPPVAIDVSEHPMIGPYKLLQEIGQGGMGTVYMAQQTEPVRRKVALKIIKPGMDSKDVLARFEAERQALAMMDHPSIAKVLDGGTTETGRPYFVMDLVHGTPITRFCDEANLSTRQRMELFVDVCRAVQHAHLKGIIHRDLKPSNVLVTMNDDKPLPKVIDFGVSKALSSPLTEKTLFTAYGQMVGTPLYMSPEQAQFTAQDVDIRSDVYSLGVMLYELLTGSTPFDKGTLKKSGWDEMRRLIREVDPPRPSARVSTLKAEQDSTLSCKDPIDARKLSQSLKGELDWIVMKALAKDRDRRYESASALAKDIERYLGNEPVEACSPSWGYLLKKFSVRHRGVLLAISFVLMAVLLSAGFSIWYAVDAGKARRLANDRLEIANAERTKAETAVERSRNLLYTADLKLASDAIRDKDIPRSAELLNRHIPSENESDLRGFEWHFFHKQSTQAPLVSLDHGDWVNDVELSPDGKWLAVSTKAGRVEVYGALTWKRKTSFAAGDVSVGAVAWSPDGKLLAAADSGGKLRIWDLSNGKMRTIPAHIGGANDLVFARDGQSLYSCGEDKLAKQWDLESAELQREFKRHERAVERIAVSLDGKRLATASSDGTFAVWNTQTAKKLYQCPDDGGRIVCVAFAADGRVAAGDIYGHISLYDHETGENWQLTQQLDGIEALTFFENGKWLATADRSGAIQLHPLPRETDESHTALPIGDPLRWIAHDGRAHTLAATADGKRLITGGRDGLVHVWAPDVQALRWHAYSDFGPTGFAVGSSNRLYLAGRCISAWGLIERRQIESFAPANPPWKRLAASSDGRWLAAGRDGELALFDGESHQKIRSWPLAEDVNSHQLAISPDGRWIAVCGYDQETCYLYSRENADTIAEFPARQCDALAFSPDGRWLAVGHMDDLRVFDLQSPGEFRTIEGHSSTLSGARFSPDGSLLATVSHDRLLTIWSFPDGREKFSLVAHHDRVRAVAFSPDGRTVTTGGDDDQVKFWHAATGQPLGALRPQVRNIRDLEFTSDGQRLIARLDEAKFAIYDASSAIRSLESSTPALASVKFHGLEDLPGGLERSYVNRVSRDGTVVRGHGHSPSGVESVFWTRVESKENRSRQFAAETKRNPWRVAAPQGDEKVNVPGPSGDSTFLAGRRWDRDHWRAYRYHAGKTTYLPPASGYSNAEAAGVTSDGRVVLGHAYNIVHAPAEQQLLVSQSMKDVRPVIWTEGGLEFLEGFDRDHQWWVEGISDDGNVVVGVTWPQGFNFFGPADHRSGVAFRWQAGEATFLGSLPDHQHSQAFAVSGDGRIIVGTCFRRPAAGDATDTGFIWDAQNGMRSLKNVFTETGADIQGWEILRGVAISSDGTTIAGNGINPNGNKEGWVAKFPQGFFGAPNDKLKQTPEKTMNNPP